MTFRISIIPFLTLFILILSNMWLVTPAHSTIATPIVDAENIELIGQLGGNSNVVAIRDNKAYLGVGPRLMILDVTYPDSPTFIGQTDILPSIIEDIALSGNYAYVADRESGLRIINVSNPADPTEAGFYDTLEFAVGVTVDGSYAYVADAESGLRIINVSNPADPTEAGFYDTAGYASDVSVVGNYAYVADSSSGLRIINVSNPTIPTEVGFYDTPGYAYGVIVDENYAYVADGSSGLRIINVSNSADPIEVGFYDTLDFVMNVSVAGNYAYVADLYEGLRIINVGNPTTPTEAGFYDISDDVRDVSVAGNYAYVADSSSGLQIINVSNPTVPTEIGIYDTRGSANKVTVAGSYAYIPILTSALRIINVDSPTAPIETAFYDTLGLAGNVVVAGNYAYVADGSSGLRIINVSNPAAPTEVGFYDTLGFAGNVVVAGNYAYVADGSSGLRIIDVSNPAAPTEVGFYDTLGFANNMIVAENYAYVADGSNGLRIINVSNPAAPIEAGFYDTPGYASDVAIAGNYAYVANGSSGLRIINVSNPAIPTEVGFYDTPWHANGVAVAGNYAYVADGGSGLWIINVSNPVAPTEAGFYDTPGYASDVAIAGSYAYVADESGGLLILRYTGDDAISGDSYEPDEMCTQSGNIPTNGTIQEHTIHQQADEDWVIFQAIAGITYRIESQIPPDSLADVTLELYDQCAGLPVEAQNYAFAPGVILEFEAANDGPIYMRWTNNDPDIFGESVSYHLSVRELEQAVTPGALIIVAGKLKANDNLQSNIHYITNQVYHLFQAQGYDTSRIYYLTTDLTIPGANSLATVDNLQAALTIWASDKVGPDRPLTLYLVDHGDRDKIYLDKPGGQWVTPTQLDSWLTQLETAHPGLKVNIIIEACHSGSFIDLSTTISKPGRVIVTSTGAGNLAYASAQGAVFSDHFTAALGQGQSLHQSFQSARWATQAAYLTQTPWLDDNGNGIANEAGDGTEAAQRGFSFAGTLSDDVWPPYIEKAEDPAGIENGQGVLRAHVLDDEGVKRVWAVIYPPSYEPPSSGEEMVYETLPTIVLQDQGNGWYAATYTGFDEMGDYRVVVYAEDYDGLEARPLAMDVRTGWAIYLPLTMK